jgi:threonyl-tRNA synthetase
MAQNATCRPAAPAASISKSLAKKAVAMTLDGDLRDLADPIDADATIGIVTRGDAMPRSN